MAILSRDSWDTYFMKIARLVSERSPCLSKQVGAVAVIDHAIIATGYNAPPRKVPHCEVCRRINTDDYTAGQGYDDCISVHAELNCVIQSARLGITLEGSTLYCTHFPCVYCLKALINAGIETVVVEKFDIKESDIIEWGKYLKIRKPHNTEQFFDRDLIESCVVDPKYKDDGGH